ncbi:MAG: SPOR domain-containing protein [Duganella sp.]
MLKFIFWSLLAINAALFAYGQGYLGHFSGNEREPERLKRQLNAQQLRLMTAEQAHGALDLAGAPASATADAASAGGAGGAGVGGAGGAGAAGTAAAGIAVATAAGPANTAALAKPSAPGPGQLPVQALACVEIGSFVLADARRFEARLAPLELGDRQSRRNLPGTEVSSYIVHIPPQASKEAADRKAAEVRALGVTNYYVISDNSPLRYGVSLGVFKTEGAAQNQLAMLVKQGVRSARITPRMSGSRQLAFQFRDVNPQVKATLDRIRADFPNTDLRTCK